jgi:hypothetical protein
MKKILLLLLPALLAGCSPTYDWREVRGAGAPYLIMLPAKPASYTRPVTLDDIQVDMSMTGAETDEVTFAVGSAQLANAAQAQKALQTMKTALVRNIDGELRHERQVPIPGTTLSATEVEALGRADASGRPRLLLARFVAHERRVYQLVVLGHERAIPQEAVDTFFSSFKPG